MKRPAATAPSQHTSDASARARVDAETLDCSTRGRSISVHATAAATSIILTGNRRLPDLRTRVRPDHQDARKGREPDAESTRTNNSRERRNRQLRRGAEQPRVMTMLAPAVKMRPIV